MPGGNSLVSVYRANDKKFLRYEDGEGKVIARMEQGKLVVTSYGMVEGYYLHPVSGKLMYLGEPANATAMRQR